GYLFVPLAEAVIFAMIASFLLSRTLVPTMANYLLRHEHHDHGGHDAPRKRNIFARFQAGFERNFERLRRRYRQALHGALVRPWRFIAIFMTLVLASFVLAPFLGQNFFPTVDGGQIKLHVSAQTGTRIEETARLVGQVEATVRKVIPPAQLSSIVDNI
ncbi:efflux RND transporter permease subunit, partial [Acidisphaera rubrifaciens]|uniref:efflux RND transporter permease subunit n=1 Tax=Acidisphaera rubrifaciens TaxID=50715 RepID=UPI000662B461